MTKTALILAAVLLSACQPAPPPVVEIRAFNPHQSHHVREMMIQCAMVNRDNQSYQRCLFDQGLTI